MSRHHPNGSDGDGSRSLLARIVDTPRLARAVSRLAPQVLHRIVEQQGLESIGDLVALATPAQINALMDIDLWRSAAPGADERFDAGRFGEWIEVLAETDVALAAATLARLDGAVLTAALAQHVFVFDPAVLHLPEASDEEFASIRPAADGAYTAEIGGYLIVARRRTAWDAITSVLVELEREHRSIFDRLLTGCRAVSDSDPEVDGLDELLSAPEQLMFDVDVDRERRREQQGYATAQQSRAFLEMARHTRLDHGTAPERSPIAEAYFRGLDDTAGEGGAADAHAEDPELTRRSVLQPEGATNGRIATPDDVVPLMELLVEAGVLAGPPRALLTAPEPSMSPVPLMQAAMDWVRGQDPDVFVRRTHELAFLSNVLLAGCSLQARAFTLQEASDAVVATCNLGLEHWPPRWTNSRPGGQPLGVDTPLPLRFLIDHDLVTVFQVGWRVLYEQVCVYAAERLVEVLTATARRLGESRRSRLAVGDSETLESLYALRAELRKGLQAGTPWAPGDALDVIMAFDIPAWATLVGLVSECPVIHGAMAAASGARILTISPSDFAFIARNEQVAAVRTFFDALPKALCG
jgi:hypothetical protein